MPTRAQIVNWYQDNKDKIQNYMETHKLGDLYQQVKKYEDRDYVDVHVYYGPRGKGYVIQVRADELPDQYNRWVHFGEEGRPDDSGWVLVVETPHGV